MKKLKRNIIKACPIIVLLWAFAAGAPAQAEDVLILKNGDRISGSYIGTSPRDMMRFQTPYGILEFPLDDIRSLNRAGDITPPPERAPYMSPVAQARVMRAVTAPAASQDTIAPQAVPAAQPIETTPDAPEKPSLMGAQWSGHINFGASMQTGNTDKKSLSSDMMLRAVRDKHRVTMKGDYNLAKDSGEKTIDNRSVEGLYDYFYTDKWFINTNLGFEQDTIRELALRSVVGAGIGHQAFQGDDLNLQYIAGLNYLRENFKNAPTENDIALRWSLDYDQRFFDGLFGIFHEHRILAPADEISAWQLRSKTGTRIPIRDGLTGTAKIDYRRDNDPPPDTTKSDTIYKLMIGYQW